MIDSPAGRRRTDAFFAIVLRDGSAQ